MTGGVKLAQVLVELLAYLLLLFGHVSWQRWLVGRFHNCPTGRSFLIIDRHSKIGLEQFFQTITFLALVASGMALPLMPDLQIGPVAWSFHLWGDADASLLYVMAAQWIGQALLIWMAARPGAAAGRLLLQVLTMLLIALGALVGASAWYGASRLSLVDWIAAQGEWGGLRWLALLQPLAAVLWVICAVPPDPGDRSRASLAWQAQALNQALLTGALFFGGWQGPFVEQLPWLGLLYTAIKVGAIAFVWTWMRAALPQPSLDAHARTVWRTWMPLAALNLIVTAAMAVAFK